MTVLDLIKNSMRSIGVLAAGENPTNIEAQDALSSLNDLVDSWSNERLMVYGVLPQTFDLVPNQASYTMGPSGDFDTVRPVKIEKCQFWYTQNNQPLPLNLHIEIIDVDQYNQFVVPGTTSTIPMWMYYDDGFPMRTLYFYTVPSIAQQVRLWTWSQISAFTELTETVSLPPGYSRALRYNLALELADDYGVTPSQALVAKAIDAKSGIKSVNAPAPLLQCDESVVSRKGGFNYLIGE